jgi:hypothetical protein
MRQKFFIFVGIIFLIVLLIGLNAATYVQQEKVPDSEFNPNRSTYNPGATGTRAFYDLLAETGRKVTRWQEPPSALLALSNSKNKPDTFVIVGEVKREFEENEIKQILDWVSAGGKLVVIDRVPHKDLIATTANWNVSAVPGELPFLGSADPSDQKQMTDGINAGKPAQPTVYTANVNAVQPSRYASSVGLERFSEEKSYSRSRNPIYKPTPMPTFSSIEDESHEPSPKTFPAQTPQSNSSAKSGEQGVGNGVGKSESSPEIIRGEKSDTPFEVSALTAPVAHLSSGNKILLVDFPFGAGKIVFLTDPYIVSNAGIGLVDNAQLAVNIVAANDGLIAFDEYHQGYGSNNNRLLSYFAGTPLLAIFLQFAVLAGLIFYSQSRRFARPLPEAEPNRLSKLEYVAAMAELQQRTRGYDLAIENIYTDFRRRVSRSLGVDNYTIARKDLAIMIAERAKIDANEAEDLMFKCEEIIYGEKTNKREVVRITVRLREIEEKLGLKRQRARRK